MWNKLYIMSPSSRRAWIEITSATIKSPSAIVALLAEGVDRNKKVLAHRIYEHVALLAEGVDRNQSPLLRLPLLQVALLAEGVDRNCLISSTVASMYCRPPRGGRG